jgi:hypothetical protein
VVNALARHHREHQAGTNSRNLEEPKRYVQSWVRQPESVYPAMIRTRSATLVFCLLLACGASSQELSHHLRPLGHILAGRDMTMARGGHTATILPNFSVMIAGGRNEHGLVLATTEIYNANKETFTSAARMNIPREGHAAASLGDGKVLVIGGATRGGAALSSCEDYDDEPAVWVRRGNMHARRNHPVAIMLRDGRVLVTGGEDGPLPLDSAETYSTLTGKWTLLAAKMSTPRVGHTATLLADGRVLLAGGTGKHRTVLNSAEVFNPQTNTFTSAGPMRDPRTLHTAVLMADGKVLLAGGSSDAEGKTALASAELYDPAANRFVGTALLNEPRMKMPNASLLLDGRPIVVGGAASAEIYEPRAEMFRTVPGGLDTARYAPASIQLMDGSLRIFGGYDSHGISTAKTWIYRLN